MTLDREKALERYRNGVNNNMGREFEKYIKNACELYAAKGRAKIEKTPEPFMVTKKERDGTFQGRFTAHAQPDFQGTLDGGRSIVFEAKYTTTDRLKRDVVTKTQRETLADHNEKDALAAVCVGIGSKFFFVPWPVWRDIKSLFGHVYVTAEDLEDYRVKFLPTGAVMFLDYVHTVDGTWISGGRCQADRWRQEGCI